LDFKTYQRAKSTESLLDLQKNILTGGTDGNDTSYLEKNNVYDFTSILDNHYGGVVKLPLSVPIYYDENGRCQPLEEPIFYDK